MQQLIAHQKKGGFNLELFKQLLEGKAAAFTLSNFLTQEECQRISNKFLASPNLRMEDVTPPIRKVGLSLYEVNHYADYFKQAEAGNHMVAELFSGSSNPMLDFLSLLREQNIGSVEPLRLGEQSASFGVLREWCGESKSGLAACIHDDFVIPKYNYRRKILQMGGLDSQFSIVICFSSGEGGITRIYDKRATVQDYLESPFRESYGFNESFVKDAQYIDVKLQTGDLMIFNSGMLHSISAVKGTRITQQCFLGMVNHSKEYKNFRYWS